MTSVTYILGLSPGRPPASEENQSDFVGIKQDTDLLAETLSITLFGRPAGAPSTDGSEPKHGVLHLHSLLPFFNSSHGAPPPLG